jgi:hypothetical protein
MAKGMRPLRVTKSVQNVNPVPVPRATNLMKNTNAMLKLKQPRIAGAPKIKRTFG